MKDLQTRANETKEQIVPILKALQVDIGAEPFLENGVIKARVVWFDTTPTEPIENTAGQVTPSGAPTEPAPETN